MKKVILLACSILLSAGIQAQFRYEAGIKAGANLSIQTTTGHAIDVDTNWKPGFHGGVYGTLFFTEKLAAQLECVYSLKGSAWSDPYFSGRENVSYIDVPLLARFQVLDLVNIHAGPQFSFLTGAWQLPDAGDATNATTYYKPADVGMAVGVEVNLSIKLNITFRIIEGLSVSTNNSYYIDPWKNRVIQVALSYAILDD